MQRHTVPAVLLSCGAAWLVLAAAGPALITPGKWENRIEVIDVQMAVAPPGVAAAMKGRPQVITSCVTAEQAAAGPRTPSDLGHVAPAGLPLCAGHAHLWAATSPTGLLPGLNSGRIYFNILLM